MDGVEDEWLKPDGHGGEYRRVPRDVKSIEKPRGVLDNRMALVSQVFLGLSAPILQQPLAMH